MTGYSHMLSGKPKQCGSAIHHTRGCTSEPETLTSLAAALHA